MMIAELVNDYISSLQKEDRADAQYIQSLRAWYLCQRFERTGSINDLNEAISDQTSALALVAEDSPSR
jgi:hypothetical protein